MELAHLSEVNKIEEAAVQVAALVETIVKANIEANTKALQTQLYRGLVERQLCSCVFYQRHTNR
jgi:hypothetical protein